MGLAQAGTAPELFDASWNGLSSWTVLVCMPETFTYHDPACIVLHWYPHP